MYRCPVNWTGRVYLGEDRLPVHAKLQTPDVMSGDQSLLVFQKRLVFIAATLQTSQGRLDRETHATGRGRFHPADAKRSTVYRVNGQIARYRYRSATENYEPKQQCIYDTRTVRVKKRKMGQQTTTAEPPLSQTVKGLSSFGKPDGRIGHHQSDANRPPHLCKTAQHPLQSRPAADPNLADWLWSDGRDSLCIGSGGCCC